MRAPLTDSDTADSRVTPFGRSRWGVRLRELTSEDAAPTLEPLDWQPKPSFRLRLRRSMVVPTAAAAVLFIAIVLVSVVTVWMQPHSIDGASIAGGEAALTGAAASPDTDATLSSGGGTVDDSGGPAAGNAPAPEQSGTLVVHVVGEVQRPGVYELPPGSRALAAIEAAGGATDSAVLASLNLARTLSDGEQLAVPNAESSAATEAGGVNDAARPVDGSGSGLISLNTADQAALETLPRVGPALAERILDWRSANGGFQSIDQLTNISGIGQKTFDQLRELVTL